MAKKLNPDTEPKIENGDKVEDLVTGITGIVTAIKRDIMGVVQVIVEPRAEDKIDPVFIDPAILKVLKKAVVSRKLRDPKTKTFLGQKVRDTVSGFTGIAFAEIESLNGCVKTMVVAKTSKKNQKSNEEFFYNDLLESLSKDEVKTKKADPNGNGGLTTKVNRVKLF